MAKKQESLIELPVTAGLESREWLAAVHDVNRLALVKIKESLELINTTRRNDKDSKTLYNLCNSISSISRAEVENERSARERSSMVIEALAELTARVSRDLQGKPELIAQLLEVMETQAKVMVAEKLMITGTSP